MLKQLNEMNSDALGLLLVFMLLLFFTLGIFIAAGVDAYGENRRMSTLEACVAAGSAPSDCALAVKK